MKIRSIIWAIDTILQFITILYHELWHFIAAKFFQLITLGDISDVKLFIDGYPKIEKNELGGITSTSMGMSVRHLSYSSGLKYSKAITFAPAVGFIVLLILSPWYMYLLYLSYLSNFWLSLGDIEKLKS